MARSKKTATVAPEPVVVAPVVVETPVIETIIPSTKKLWHDLWLGVSTLATALSNARPAIHWASQQSRRARAKHAGRYEILTGNAARIGAVAGGAAVLVTLGVLAANRARRS